MTIATKEQLRDHIHAIHDFLRNCGAGYGMTAMKIFMIFYGLKIIEPIIDKTPLDPKICKFSKIIKNANKKYEKKDNPISNFIDRDILDDIIKDECQTNKYNLGFYMFHQIPKNLRDDVWIQVIKYIDEIPTNKNKTGKKIDEKFDVDLSGKVYEYFIGRDATAISELGAYFTDRHVTGYVMNKVKPTLKDGSVKKMIDPFGGSGGFTLGYTQYLNSKFGDKIDWKKDIKKIYHFDMNEDVIKIAGIEMFGLTECLPNKEAQFKRVNTFKYEFDEQYDYIFTNPPYGGDKNKKNTDMLKNDKLIAYINKDLIDIKEQLKDDPKNKTLLKTQKNRQNQVEKLKKNIAKDKKDQDDKKVNSGTCSKLIKNYIKDNELKTCNDKEACSLVLLMTLLNKNGVCAGVLKEGVFFDKKYGSIRKCLIENFNVKYVISVPQDQFENTSTKTSIVIFENTKEKTKEIIFYDLVVEKEKDDVFEEVDDEIQLVKCKDDIINVKEKEVCRCDVDDMKDDYSLNYKNYLNNDIKVQKGFKLVKLEDICIINPENKNNKIGDELLYVEIGDINENKINNMTKYDKNSIPNNSKKHPHINDVLICSVRPKSSKIVYMTKEYIQDNLVITGAIFNLRFKNILMSQYVFYYLINGMDNTLKIMGNGSSYPRLTPTTVMNFKIPYPDDNTMKKLEPILTKLMKLHEESQKLSNDIPQKEKDICSLIKKLTDEGKKGTDYDEYKLGEVCDYIKTGKNKTPDDKKGTLYPYYGTLEITGYTDHYLFDGEHILMARNGSKLHENCFFVSGKFYPSDHVFAIKNNNKIVDLKYLYYYMLCKTDIFKHISNGSTVKGISKKDLENVITKVFSQKIIKNKFQSLFEEVDKMKSDLETTKKEHYELSIKFMKMIDLEYKSTNTRDKDDSSSESDDASESSDSSEDEKPKKKKQAKVKKSKDDFSDSSDDEKPKKKKPAKKKYDSDSDSLSEGDIDIRTKKVIRGK